MGSSSSPPGHTRARLLAGAARLAVPLASDQLDALEAYAEELLLWAPRFNLISIRDLDSFVDRHLLDSLAAAPLIAPLARRPRILDIGSGAGLPGVPVAIATRAASAYLVEPRQHRASFLRAVARRLPGFGLEIVPRRIEDVDPASNGNLDAVLSRATLPLEQLLACSSTCLRIGGLLVSFRAIGQHEPPAAAASSFRKFQDRLYSVAPGAPQMKLSVWEREG